MLKKGYCYLFYKLYILFDNEQFKWLPEIRTYILLLVIESLVFDTIISCILLLIDQKEFLSANARLIYTLFFIFLAIYNYSIFLYNDKWKKIIKSFANLGKKRDRIGTLIVYSILFIISISWLYSVYLWATDK